MAEATNEITRTLDQLDKIAAAKAAATGPSTEDKAKARTLTKAIEVIKGDTAKEATVATAYLTAQVAALAPEGGEGYDRSTATKLLALLAAHDALGNVVNGDKDRYTALKAQLARTANPAPAIEGRPARISITAPNGTVYTSMRGNSPNSPSNVRQSIVDYCKRNDITLSDEQLQSVRDAASAVCKDNVLTTVLGFTLTPSE